MPEGREAFVREVAAVPADMPADASAVRVAADWSGEVTPGHRVAGLSLLGRLLRQLYRAGGTMVQIETSDPSRVDRLRREFPTGLDVRVRGLAVQSGGAESDENAGTSDEDAGTSDENAGTSDENAGSSGADSGSSFGRNRERVVVGPIDAVALYDQGDLARWIQGETEIGGETEGSRPGEMAGEIRSQTPSPMLRLSSHADLRPAASLLWNGANKTLEHDGLVAYFVGRPLARLFSRVLVATLVTPNQVTVVSLVVGLAGAASAALGTYWGFVVGAFLYWFGMVVDCVDGDLARVRVEGSRLGQWLDTIADDLSTSSFTAGMGIGVARLTGHQWWAWLGVAGAVGILLQAIHVYRGLVRMRLPIDTARYPWFFLGKDGVVRSEGNSIGSYLAYAVRRDFSSAAYFVLCVFGAYEAVALFAAAGAAVVFVLAAIDTMVRIFGGSDGDDIRQVRSNQ